MNKRRSAKVSAADVKPLSSRNSLTVLSWAWAAAWIISLAAGEIRKSTRCVFEEASMVSPLKLTEAQYIVCSIAVQRLQIGDRCPVAPCGRAETSGFTTNRALTLESRRWRYGAARYSLNSLPTPSITTSTVLPGFIGIAPSEVPQRITSPGCSVMSCEISETSCTGLKIMSEKG